MIDNQYWARRYKLQAQWTKEIRKYITQQISLPKQAKVLEVGCGSLAILEEFATQNFISFGLDIDYSILNFQTTANVAASRINADGYKLPFPDSCFDFCYCHYLLLWLSSPLEVLKELQRVTKNSGYVCCFAEPDYLGRIDYPPTLEEFGNIQNQSLKKQGVNLSTGRQLAEWFSNLQLSNVTWGILGSHNNTGNQTFHNHEWETMKIDIRDEITPEEILQYQEMDLSAQQDGSRIFFVPTFYAYAQVIKTESV